MLFFPDDRNSCLICGIKCIQAVCLAANTALVSSNLALFITLCAVSPNCLATTIFNMGSFNK